MNFIFDDMAVAFSKQSVKEIQRKTGLKRNRIYNLKNGCTFFLDYNLCFALAKMGYRIKLEKIKKN